MSAPMDAYYCTSLAKRFKRLATQVDGDTPSSLVRMADEYERKAIALDEGNP